MIAPKLVEEQFDETGRAGIDFRFAGKAFSVSFTRGAGQECVAGAYLGGAHEEAMKQLRVEDGRVRIPRDELLALPESGNTLLVELV